MTNPAPDQQPPAPPYAYGYPPAPPRGVLAWALGLIGLLFLPFLNLIISGVVMTVVGARQRRAGGLAAVNGRGAANWGLTVLVIDVPSAVLWIVTLSIEAQGFFPWGISVIVWALLSIANLVAAIVGIVRAGAGRPVRFPAIPFLR